MISTRELISDIISKFFSGSKVQFEGQNYKKKNLANTNKNKCNTSFYVILAVENVSDDLLMIQDHFQGQGQFEDQICANTNRNKCNTSFWCYFDWKIRLF